jgi:transglutaminase-like putative cysteine protease
VRRAARRARKRPLRLPGSLPRTTSFVGREQEIAAVAALLRQDHVRLLTLTGSGGIGKTRLALRVAEVVAAAFSDGIHLVALAALVGPEHVAVSVAAALGLRDTAGLPTAQEVIHYLRDKQTLLMLDNFEHLQSAAPFIATHVSHCPPLRILYGVPSTQDSRTTHTGQPAVPGETSRTRAKSLGTMTEALPDPLDCQLDHSWAPRPRDLSRSLLLRSPTSNSRALTAPISAIPYAEGTDRTPTSEDACRYLRRWRLSHVRPLTGSYDMSAPIARCACKPFEGVPPMHVRVGCRLVYESTWPTPALLQIQPRSEQDVHVLDARWTFTPECAWRDFRDPYGNVSTRLIIPSGTVQIAYDALVELAGAPDLTAPLAEQVPVELLPDNTLHFTLASRYCLSDELSDTAWRLFGQVQPGWSRVQAICDWVHENIYFSYGASTPRTTAVDIYNQRVGVCRDFAHLAVSFCRALNIPARYVFGYLPDIGVPPSDSPMDFCAWMEVYLADHWYTFDPRNNQPRIGHIVIGRGRDALDVAMVTSYGSADLREMLVWADEVATPTQRAGA